MAFWRQIPVVGAGALALGLWAAPSDARDGAQGACASTYEDAVAHQQAGHLREARTLALQCARAACGTLQRKCAASAEQLRSDIALIAPVVTDEKGTPLVDVQVKMDQQPLTSRLDGHELAVDPGLHDLTVTAKVGKWPGHEVTATRKVMIVQGQRGPLTIALSASDEGSTAPAPASTATAAAPSAPAAPEEPSSTEPAPEAPRADAAPVSTQHHGLSAWPFVIGGVGVLGLGAGALLTYWGKTDNDALSSCSPSCAPSSVDHIRRLYLAADISFGVGGAALGVAALLFATSHPGSHEVAPSTAVFDVRPTRSGAVASFQGVF
ncbi:MAG TPA: hypothetical protein VMI75_05355 [Polyangiaceae bacterium]|nr:hypothetical protein [Polyangiaceae bacterium]